MSECKKCRDEDNFLEAIIGNYDYATVSIYEDELEVRVDKYGASVTDKIKINYCPFCGRELGK